MNLTTKLKSWITNPALKVPDLKNLPKESIIRPLSPNSLQSSMFKEAMSESFINEKDFTNVLAATLYTTGKLASKLPDRKAKVAGAVGMIAGKGIKKGKG